MTINTLYLPPEGKYQPRVPPGYRESYGYPWQYNPLRHKHMSEERFCHGRYVYRRYCDNKVIYTRNPQQLAVGACSYYLYNKDHQVIETGDFLLPPDMLRATDLEKHKENSFSGAPLAAFVRSLPRTNVMTVCYTRKWNSNIGYYQLAGIRYHPAVAPGTPIDEEGNYLTGQQTFLYTFGYNGKEDVDVFITRLSPSQQEQQLQGNEAETALPIQLQTQTENLPIGPKQPKTAEAPQYTIHVSAHTVANTIIINASQNVSQSRSASVATLYFSYLKGFSLLKKSIAHNSHAPPAMGQTAKSPPTHHTRVQIHAPP